MNPKDKPELELNGSKTRALPIDPTLGTAVWSLRDRRQVLRDIPVDVHNAELWNRVNGCCLDRPGGTVLQLVDKNRYFCDTRSCSSVTEYAIIAGP